MVVKKEGEIIKFIPMPVVVSITRHIFSYPFFFKVVQPLVEKMSIVEFIKYRRTTK